MPAPRCAPCTARRLPRHRSALPTSPLPKTNTDLVDTHCTECLHIMVVLYHTTSFGSTERGGGGCSPPSAASPWPAVLARGGDPPEPPDAAAAAARLGHAVPAASAGRSEARARGARGRLLFWMERAGVQAVVLTRPGPVSWLTGGLPPPVDRSAATDLVWAVVTGPTATLITTEVEADRIRTEYRPDQHGFTGVVAVPWYDPDAFVHAAAEIAGAPAIALTSDGHPAFGTDSSDDLTELRLALSMAEQDDLRALGADAAQALEAALTAWSPGERDLDIQARVAAALETRGADTPVLIVGGDDRVQRYRHPMAAGAPVHRLAMAVVVARRGGLHAAATRFACAGPLGAQLRPLWDRVGRIERDTLAASRSGCSYGSVLATLDRGYAREGAMGGWAGHYQG